ncbi:polyprotein [Puccinia sorghi]|uniref:Polyprotein n=1 Tax=Puccinia sorghi TaxID=27349 RepID=A0A0L6VHS7_9BASI|nr:polyprotein [Puccinia sorghi]
MECLSLARTKHFRVHLHWVREKVNSQEISTQYVSTHSNLADFLTKSLCKQKHNACVGGVNLTG